MSTQEQKLKLSEPGAFRVGVAAALAAVALASASAVHAADPGLTVVRDPDTGLLRAPTADEFKALQAQSIRDNAGKAAQVQAAQVQAAPVAIQRADGATRLTLGENHMSYAVVTRNADGTLTEQCVTGADTANKIVSGKSVSTTKNAKGHLHDHR